MIFLHTSTSLISLFNSIQFYFESYIEICNAFKFQNVSCISFIINVLLQFYSFKL
jgi:protein involved in sex pheromone biosynthesis